MQIRSKVFETNSSSFHSLVIDYGSPLNEQPFSDYETAQGFVEVEAGEFGWTPDSFFGVHDKLSYLFTSAASWLEDDQDPNEVTDNDRLNLLKEAVKEHTGLGLVFKKNNDYYPLGYIDHQSADVPDEAFEDVPTLIRFFFSPNSYFETDNDNH